MPSLFNTLPHLILIPALGNGLSYSHFTDEEGKSKSLNDLPTAIKLAEVVGLDSFLA